MSKIGLDKVLHFVACFIIVAVVTLFVGAIPGFPFIGAQLIGLVAGIVAGVGKELYDVRHGSIVDKFDLLADLLGALVAFGFTFLM